MPKFEPIKITLYDAQLLAKLGWSGLTEEQKLGLNGHQLRFLLRWLGVSDRGTNQAKRERAELVTNVRIALLPYPRPTWDLEHDDVMLKNMAKAFTSLTLYTWLRELGLYRSGGRKTGYCRTLLTWREQCRVRGEEFIRIVNQQIKEAKTPQTRMQI